MPILLDRKTSQNISNGMPVILLFPKYFFLTEIPASNLGICKMHDICHVFLHTDIFKLITKEKFDFKLQTCESFLVDLEIQ